MTKKAQPRSARAGLKLPVSRVEGIVRKVLPRERRLAVEAAIGLTAIGEYIAAEVLELAAANTRRSKRTIIRSRDIMMAVKSDEELHDLLGKYKFRGAAQLVYLDRETISSVKDRKVKRRRRKTAPAAAAKAESTAPRKTVATASAAKKKKKERDAETDARAVAAKVHPNRAVKAPRSFKGVKAPRTSVSAVDDDIDI